MAYATPPLADADADADVDVEEAAAEDDALVDWPCAQPARPAAAPSAPTAPNAPKKLLRDTLNSVNMPLPHFHLVFPDESKIRELS